MVSSNRNALDFRLTRRCSRSGLARARLSNGSTLQRLISGFTRPLHIGSARRWLHLGSACASLLLAGGVMEARGADIAALEAQLINPCPNCGGLPLAGSYCGGAAAAKQELRALAAQGKTDEEILAAFVDKYGQWILATPPRKGFTLLAWILPMLGIVVGGGGLAMFLKRARTAPVREPRAGERNHPQTSPDISREVSLNDAARAHYREVLRRELGEA